ncbi:MAG: hypothetical protein GHCLOJNM_00366 [bacterium]|nr:hypothetical protein [bacterium]
MDKHTFDPSYRRALHEAIFTLVVFIIPLAFTVIYCARTGYDRDPHTVGDYWGIPDWVFWGVFVPWTVCVGFTAWFTFFHMVHDDPEEVSPADDMEAARSGMKAEGDAGGD